MEENQKISALPMLRASMARTMVGIDEKNQYEVITSNIDLIEGRAQNPRYANVNTAVWKYETVVYSLVPLKAVSDLLRPAAEKYAQLIGLDNGYVRQLEWGDLYIQRTMNEEDASMEHDKTVHALLKGDIVLIPFFERLSLYGIGTI